MNNLLNRSRLSRTIGNWDWQPQMFKEQFEQLTLADVTIEFGKENEMLNRIAIRLNKSRFQVIRILKSLEQF